VGGADVPAAEGTLSAELAGIIASIAAEFTTTAEHCWFGIWDGFGWLYASRSEPPTGMRTLAHLPPVEGIPRLRLPDRDYLLFSAPVGAVLALADYPTQQTPNLWWPDDHAWYVATDIDLTSTYVGGPMALIERLLADSRLAAMPAHLADSLLDR
jgi:hypothetical protein